MENTSQKRNPWAWIPTLYFAQGIPYVSVMTIAVIMFKRLGLSNTDIALYTSWLYLPWVIKPLWSPFVDLLKTKRWWIVTMQLIIGAGFAGIAFSIPTTFFLQSTLAFFWLVAFSSATHDIAADGFYMIALDEHEQALFVGIRSTFYRIAMIAGQGVLVMLAGVLETYTNQNIPLAWSLTFYTISALFILVFVYHSFILPKPSGDAPSANITARNLLTEFGKTFVTFFQKPEIGKTIFFLLTYRLAESQIVKLASPFMLDSKEVGGLGLSTSEVGLLYGTIGVIALTCGGILGGIAASTKGLKYWIWPMAFSLTVTNWLYVFLAQTQPDNMFIIGTTVAIEQFGYGFGFTAYMLYMIYVAAGEHKTAHYAICTAFMALGMMLPGMAAGWIEDMIGYKYFFLWVVACTSVVYLAVSLLKIDSKFGVKAKKA